MDHTNVNLGPQSALVSRGDVKASAERVNEIVERLSGTCGLAREIGDRLLGSEPQAPDKMAPSEQPYCEMSELQIAISKLDRIADDLAGRISRLGRL